MLSAIVLTAGYASRAKVNKITLKIDGLTVIERILLMLKPYCESIVVVTGHYHDEISEIMKYHPSVTVVKNERYDLGMFSSVQAGVRLMKNDFILIPGDYPLIEPTTIVAITKGTCNANGIASGKINSDIVVPTYNGRKGHPIVIKQRLIQPLLEEDIGSNLKVFRDRYEVAYIPVEDEGILLDIDTIDDYHHILRKAERGSIH
ncbi:MAG: nucleotidyltransferase family protein [Vallitaleaceae bacterium]|jgi:molybdenum cofactor cytidylyltransferase|nr:nucleotidyltransferase family protein [Vallitaleaceae bacterium]